MLREVLFCVDCIGCLCGLGKNFLRFVSQMLRFGVLFCRNDERKDGKTGGGCAGIDERTGRLSVLLFVEFLLLLLNFETYFKPFDEKKCHIFTT